MVFYQQEFSLRARTRGFHLITDEIMEQFPEVQTLSKGMLEVFIKHTSASLTINENADPSVRVDFESHFNHMVPENQTYYKHIYEGPDDMPAHIKASILGNSLSIPVTNGKLNLGIWQGIYLCEHRDHASRRTIVVTAFGALI